MPFLLTLLVFLFIIGFLIASHEVGHFLAAKKAGLRIEEFALGFPPKIFSRKKGETVYSLNLIPFGGFVKIHGEETEEGVVYDQRSFNTQPPSTKAKILLAGVFMNILVAVFIFYLFLGLGGFKANVSLPFDYNFPLGQQQNFPLIVSVLEDSPAEKAGLSAGDFIVSIDGEIPWNQKELSEIINAKQEQVSLVVAKAASSESEKREVKVLPQEDQASGKFLIGVALSDLTEVSYQGFFGLLFSGFLHTANMTHLSFSALTHMISESWAEKTIDPFRENVVSVVGIFAITHVFLEEGIIEILNLIALISIALAVVNILPIPALDGGRLVFVLYEALFKKQASFSFERKLNFVGLIIIILLVVFVIYNDILRFGGVIKQMF